MHQNVQGKNVRITKNVREHISEKMKRIRVSSEKIVDANIICEHTSAEYIVQGTITFGKHVFHLKEKSKDLYVAIDNMFQKIEREIVRIKDKNIDRTQKVKDKNEIEKSYSIMTHSIYEKPLDNIDAVHLFSTIKSPYFAYLQIKQGEDLYSIKISRTPVFLFKDGQSFKEIYFEEETSKSEYVATKSGHWYLEELKIYEDKNIDTSSKENYTVDEFNVSEAVNFLTEHKDLKYLVYINAVTDLPEALYRENETSFALIRMLDI